MDGRVVRAIVGLRAVSRLCWLMVFGGSIRLCYWLMLVVHVVTLEVLCDYMSYYIILVQRKDFRSILFTRGNSQSNAVSEN